MLKRYFANPDVRTGALCLGVLLVVAMLFYAPVLTGRVLPQGDVVQAKGMQQDIVRFRAAHDGEEPYWTDSMFGGMPAETVTIHYRGNLMLYVHQGLSAVLPYPIPFLFLGMVLFFALLRASGVRAVLALAGAIGYGMFSYHVMIVEAGHTNKFQALMTAPGVLWAVVRIYQSRYMTGGALLFLLVGLNLYYNHVQMSYYLFLVVGCLVAYQLVQAALRKQWRSFGAATGTLAAGTLLAVLLNAVPLYPLYSYSQYTIRGKNELQTAAAGSTAEGGLSRDDYAYLWSYDRGELLTLLIPNAYGGASSGSLPQDGATVRTLQGLQLQADPRQIVNQLPGYWGQSSFTNGPFYLGAVLLFFALLGVYLVRGGLKWALLYALLLGLLLSLGKYSFSVWGGLAILALPGLYAATRRYVKLPEYLYGTLVAVLGYALVVLLEPPAEQTYRLTDLLFDYLPLYDKFRVPSSILVMTAFTAPWLALLGAQALLRDDQPQDSKLRAVYYSAAVLGGLCLLMAMGLGSSLLGFDFRGAADARLEEQVGPDIGAQLLSAIRSDRETLLTRDAWRSLALILMGAGLAWLAARKQLKATGLGIALTLLVAADLWLVNRRILPNEAYQRKTEFQANFEPGEAERLLAQDSSHFRVFPLTRNPFNDGRTPYFLNTIGGYNAAKLRRYQQLIERHLSQGLGTPNVLNMLNTKYVFLPQAVQIPWLRAVYQTRQGEFIYLNTTAYGPAWIAREVVVAPTPDQALDTLSGVFSFETAVVEQAQQAALGQFSTDSVDRARETVVLTQHDNNLLRYRYQSDKARFVTFSEVYHPEGWTATIDGQTAPILRTNFVLRGLVVPAGAHTIEFRYAPPTVQRSETVSTVLSVVLVLVLGAAGWQALRTGRRPDADPTA